MIVCKIDLELLSTAGIDSEKAIDELHGFGVEMLELTNYDPANPEHQKYLVQETITLAAVSVRSDLAETMLDQNPGIPIVLDFGKEDYDPYFLTDQQKLTFMVGQLANRYSQSKIVINLNVNHFTIINNVMPSRIFQQNLTQANVYFRTDLTSLYVSGTDPLSFMTRMKDKLDSLELNAIRREYIEEVAKPVRTDFEDMELPLPLLETVSHALRTLKLVFDATKPLILHDFAKISKNFKKISAL